MDIKEIIKYALYISGFYLCILILSFQKYKGGDNNI